MYPTRMTISALEILLSSIIRSKPKTPFEFAHRSTSNQPRNVAIKCTSFRQMFCKLEINMFQMENIHFRAKLISLFALFIARAIATMKTSFFYRES